MVFCSGSSATATMPSYKLTYFDARGRGEIARMVLAAAGQKYENVRVSFEDWPALKPSKIKCFPFFRILLILYSNFQFCLQRRGWGRVTTGLMHAVLNDQQLHSSIDSCHSFNILQKDIFAYVYLLQYLFSNFLCH